MNRYGLTSEQEKLLLDLIQCDDKRTHYKGFIHTIHGDDKIMVPQCFGEAAVMLRDLEALCDAGLLVLEKSYPNRSYRINNVAYKVARLLKQEKQAQKTNEAMIVDRPEEKEWQKYLATMTIEEMDQRIAGVATEMGFRPERTPVGSGAVYTLFKDGKEQGVVSIIRDGVTWQLRQQLPSDYLKKPDPDNQLAKFSKKLMEEMENTAKRRLRQEQLLEMDVGATSSVNVTALQKTALAFREKSNRYLLAFYNEVYPDSEKTINAYDLGSKLGFTREETTKIKNVWQQKRFIKPITFGGHCLMYPRAFDWVENNLLGLPLATWAIESQETIGDEKSQAETGEESEETADSVQIGKMENGTTQDKIEEFKAFFCQVFGMKTMSHILNFQKSRDGAKFSVEIQRPLSEVDAAVEYCFEQLRMMVVPIEMLDWPLPDDVIKSSRKMKVVREQTTLGSITYHYLSAVNVREGPFGGCKIRQVGTNLTLLSVFPPPRYREEPDKSYAKRSWASLLHTALMLKKLWMEGYWSLEIDAAALSPPPMPQKTTDSKSSEKSKRTKVTKPHPGTIGKINQLIKIRDQEIKEWNRVPLWTNACKVAKIEPRTVHKHYPELAQNWEFKHFRPEKWEYRE